MEAYFNETVPWSFLQSSMELFEILWNSMELDKFDIWKKSYF